MNNITLRIGPDLLLVDTSEISGVSINYSIKDIKNYGKRNSSFTKTIKILQTPNTNRIFKSLFNINTIGGYDVGTKVYGEIYENSIPILKGYIQVVKVALDHYEIILFSNNISIFDDMGTKLIKGNFNAADDISFDASSYFHTWTRDNIRTALNLTPPNTGVGYIYPIIDYNNTLTWPSLINLSRFDADSFSDDYPVFPAIAARQIFDKIFATYGYTYEMSSDILDVLNRMYLPFNDDYINHTKPEYIYAKYYLGNAQKYFKPSDPQDTTIQLTVIEYTNPFSLEQWPINTPMGWTFTDNHYTDPSNNVSGGYDNFFKSPTNASDNNPGIPIPHRGQFRIDVSLWIYNPTGESVNSGWNLSTWTSIDGLKTYALGAIDINAHSGAYFSGAANADFVEKGYVYIHRNMSTDFNARLVFGPWCSVQVAELNSLNGATFELNTILPRSYTQADFVNDVFKIFNAYVTVDDIDERKLFIKSYRDFYSTNGNIYDWSKKVDESTIEFEPIRNNFSKTTNFKYTTDSDVYNIDYDGKLPLPIYSKVVNNESQFTESENNIVLSVSPGILRYVEGSNYTIWSSVKAPVGGVQVLTIADDSQFLTAWKPRLLFANTWDISAYRYGTDKDYVANPYIRKWTTLSPRMTLDLNSSSNVFLGFDSANSYLDQVERESNETLYNKYYQADIESNLDTETYLLSGEFLLNGNDINQVNFNDLIWIENYDIGNAYYRLNAINGYTPSGGTCKVELIKYSVNDYAYDTSIAINKFTRSYSGLNEIRSGGISGAANTTSSTSLDASLYYTADELDGGVLDPLYTKKLVPTIPNYFLLGDGHGDISVGINLTLDNNYLKSNTDISVPTGRSIWIGTTADSSGRLRLHQLTDNSYIDFGNHLYIRGGLTSSSYLFSCTSSGKLGVGLNMYDPKASIQIAKGGATGDGSAPSGFSLNDEYLHLGGGEYGLNSNRLIGFGYVTGNNSPAYIGYQEKTIMGYTYGDLVFGTRTTPTDSHPDERMRINNRGYIGDKNYLSGFTGYAWNLANDASKWSLELDNLIVRGSLSAYELVINKIRATNGSLWVSDAVRAINTDTSLYTKAGLFNDGNYYFLVDPENNTFAADDVIRAQKFTGNSVVLHNWKVTSISGEKVYVISLDGETLSTSLDITNFDFVRVGNVTNPGRQGSLYLTSSDTNSPYLEVIDGVNSYTIDPSDHKVRLGKLDGLNFNGASIAGYGLWTSNAYLTGSVNANAGFIGNFSIENGTLTGYGDYEEKITLDPTTPSILINDASGVNSIEITTGPISTVASIIAATDINYTLSAAQTYTKESRGYTQGASYTGTKLWADTLYIQNYNSLSNTTLDVTNTLKASNYNFVVGSGVEFFVDMTINVNCVYTIPDSSIISGDPTYIEQTTTEIIYSRGGSYSIEGSTIWVSGGSTEIGTQTATKISGLIGSLNGITFVNNLKIKSLNTEIYAKYYPILKNDFYLQKTTKTYIGLPKSGGGYYWQLTGNSTSSYDMTVDFDITINALSLNGSFQKTQIGSSGILSYWNDDRYFAVNKTGTAIQIAGAVNHIIKNQDYFSIVQTGKGGTITPFSVDASAHSQLIEFRNRNNNTGLAKGIRLLVGPNTGTSVLMEFRRNSDAAFMGRIIHNGTTTSYLGSSDSRLKENIVDCSFNGTELIKQIQVRNFDWKDNGRSDLGFIAQELKEVWPKAVPEISDPSDYYGVSMGDMVPLLVKVIQELETRIKILEAK